MWKLFSRAITKSISKKAAKQTFVKVGKSAFGGTNNGLVQFVRWLDSLLGKNTQARSNFAKNFVRNIHNDKVLDKILKRALTKNFYGTEKLSVNEKKLLDLYERLSDDPKDKEEIQQVNSSWIIWAKYKKSNKSVLLHCVRGKQYYWFYKVPRTKWLALTQIGGTYMWDWFGKHYSINPGHWIRKAGV